jgi:Flp pilus assembly protein TadD
MTADEKEVIYSIAHSFMTNGRYQQAEGLLSLLVTLTPDSARYWCALGAVVHARRNLNGAALAFAVAFRLDPDDDLVALNLGEVAKELGELETSRNILRPLAEKKTGPIAQRARALLQAGGHP